MYNLVLQNWSSIWIRLGSKSCQSHVGQWGKRFKADWDFSGTYVDGKLQITAVFATSPIGVFAFPAHVHIKARHQHAFPHSISLVTGMWHTCTLLINRQISKPWRPTLRRLLCLMWSRKSTVKAEWRPPCTSYIWCVQRPVHWRSAPNARREHPWAYLCAGKLHWSASTTWFECEQTS